MRSGLPRVWTAQLAIAAALVSWPAFAQTVPGRTTAWGTSQQVLGQTRVSNATLRPIACVTAPGDAIRLRFDNTRPLPTTKAPSRANIKAASRPMLHTARMPLRRGNSRRAGNEPGVLICGKLSPTTIKPREAFYVL